MILYRVRSLVLKGLVLVTLLGVCPAFAFSESTPQIGAQSAILIDVYNGQIMYQKDADTLRPMASTTKVMTAVVALGSSDLQSKARVSEHADRVGESSMYLEKGEILTLEQLLYGALMPSGNDACVAIAEHVAGSEDFFVLLMNEKAALIGAVNSSFKNTNGLPAKGHYSTAKDLAVITRYALHDDAFCDVVKTKFKVVKGPDSLEHYLRNTNQLLWSYPGADGVKTGTTVEAGKCLIASANKGDRRLLAVVLNDNDRFNDAEKLFDYGFNEFKLVRKIYSGEIYSRIPVVDGKAPSLPVKVGNTISLNLQEKDLEKLEQRVELPRTVKAPIRVGEKLGRIEYYLDGNMIGSSAILAAATIGRASIIQKVKEKTYFYLDSIY